MNLRTVWRWLDGKKTAIALLYYEILTPILPVWFHDGVPEGVQRGYITIGIILGALGLGHKAVKGSKGGGGSNTPLIPIVACAAILGLSGLTGCSKRNLKDEEILWDGIEEPVIEEQAAAPAAEPQRTVYTLETAAPAVVRTNRTVYFNFDSDVVSPDQMAAISEIAAAARGCAGEIVLVGGACPIGEEPYNRDLGQRRAEALSRVLQVSYGLESCDIKVRTVGEHDLVSDNPANYGLNRRCEMTVEVQG